MTLRVFSAVGLVLCLAASSCSRAAETTSPPPASVRLSRTSANDLQTALARIPHVKAEIVSEGGSSITSLMDLKNQKTNVSGTLADVAYLAYAGQLEEIGGPFEQLRGMAVTGLNTMHLIVGRNVRVRTLGDLKGLRVSLGAPGSSTALITLRMLQDLGIATGQIHASRIPNNEIVNRLTSGDLDAAFSGFSVPKRSRDCRLAARREARPHRRPGDRGDADAVSVLETHADSERDVPESIRAHPHARRRHASCLPRRARRRRRVFAAGCVLRHQTGDNASEPRTGARNAHSPSPRRGAFLPPARAESMSRERRGATGPRKRAAWSGAGGPRD